MKVKIQIDGDTGFASVHNVSDHSMVFEPEEMKKQKPVTLEVANDEYVRVAEDMPEDEDQEPEGQGVGQLFPKPLDEE
jgi:hypothetical protein